MNKEILLFLVSVALLISCKEKPEWVSTTEKHPWQVESGLKINQASNIPMLRYFLIRFYRPLMVLAPVLMSWGGLRSRN